MCISPVLTKRISGIGYSIYCYAVEWHHMDNLRMPIRSGIGRNKNMSEIKTTKFIKGLLYAIVWQAVIYGLFYLALVNSPHYWRK